MNHSSVKPALAPSFGVTISSPEPTMEAVMIRPGPSWRTMPLTEVGAGCVCVAAGDDTAEGWGAGVVDTGAT
jgi:hypothetical protein